MPKVTCNECKYSVPLGYGHFLRKNATEFEYCFCPIIYQIYNKKGKMKYLPWILDPLEPRRCKYFKDGKIKAITQRDYKYIPKTVTRSNWRKDRIQAALGKWLDDHEWRVFYKEKFGKKIKSQRKEV